LGYKVNNLYSIVISHYFFLFDIIAALGPKSTTGAYLRLF